MKRREFIALLGAALIEPVATQAEQTARLRRIGVLMAHPESDPEFQEYADAFRDGLRNLGWLEGRNISLDFRWGALDDADMRSRSAKELVALRPDLILTQNTSLTARHKLPAIYPWRFFVEIGGLLSYGSEQRDEFRLAASYADRILKGEKPSELPVQAPTQYDLVINLKTANRLGLAVSPQLQQLANKLLE